MSEFQFVCPFCETMLDCPEELDSVETECPICNEKIVPTISNDVFSECSEDEELRKEIDEQKEEFLQEQEQKQEIYPFIAKCPACKKVIELERELKYSKQQCPFCNKTVLLNTVKNQNNNPSSSSAQPEKSVNAKCPICKSIISCSKNEIGIQRKCPSCGNWIRFKEYKQQVVNKKNYNFPEQQELQQNPLLILSPAEKHDAFKCWKCENIVIISKNSESHIICPCCEKFIKQSAENRTLEQQDDGLTNFISSVKYEAGLKDKKVFFTNLAIQEKLQKQIKQRKKAKEVDDAVTGCAGIIAVLGVIGFIIFCLGSCIASCDTSSTEMSEEAKTYLMLKEAQDRLEKRKKERTIENLVDIMDSGY